MADPSFDVVSKIDRQEVDNALNQAAKEIAQRFDFRGTNAVDRVVRRARRDDQGRHRGTGEGGPGRVQGEAGQALDLAEGAGRGRAEAVRQAVRHRGVYVKQGIGQDEAKKIAKLIRDEGPKGVQAQIQGDQLRVSGKKKDDLQAVIALLKGADLDVALQFTNYR